MKKFANEFKDFIAKGNVVDMAVGVVVGGAFGKIVTSLVEDIIMPPISKLLSGVNVQEMFYALDGNKYATLQEARDAAAPIIAYGNFIQNIINFLIIALVIFIVIKQVGKVRPQEEAPAPTTKVCPYCKSEIPVEAVKCPHCTSDLK